MGLTTGGQLPYNCVHKVAFLWWVLPWLGQSSLLTFVPFCEPLSLPKVVTLDSSSGNTAPSGALSTFGAPWRASFERGLGPLCYIKGLDPVWTDDDGDPALMVLRVCSAFPKRYIFFFSFGCRQLRTRDASREFTEHCSFCSSCLSSLPRSVARCRGAMAMLWLLGMVPFHPFGHEPATLPPLVSEGVLGGVGQGLQGSVPFSTGMGQAPQYGLEPAANELIIRRPEAWDQIFALLVFLAFFGHAPAFFYKEEASTPFQYLNVHTQVYKATMTGFRRHAVRVRRNRGLGQCFWRSTGNQCSWYKRKSMALQYLLPSTTHNEQGSPFAWATHTEIAAFAQGASTRVVVVCCFPLSGVCLLF